MEAARLLLEAGANAEEHPDGEVFYEACWAPIHLATFSGNVALVELLLSHGVSPISPDFYSSVPLHCARTAEMARFLVPLTKQHSRWGLEETDDEGRTPVHDMALRGDDEGLRILLENGADASYHDGEAGRFPLHRAAPGYWRRCCELLLDFGADINATDTHDRTVLDETLAPSVFIVTNRG